MDTTRERTQEMVTWAKKVRHQTNTFLRTDDPLFRLRGSPDGPDLEDLLLDLREAAIAVERLLELAVVHLGESGPALPGGLD